MILLLGLAHAACEPPADAVQEFLVKPEFANGYPLVVELRADDLDAVEPWAEALEARGWPATIVVTADVARADKGTAKLLSQRGHELVPLWEPPVEELRTVDAWWGASRELAKDFKRASGNRPKAVSAPAIPRIGELGLDQTTVRVQLVESTVSSAHTVMRPDGTRGSLLMIPLGPHGCQGLSPSVEPWAMDDLATTIQTLPELRLPAARLVLDVDALTDPAGLEAWLDEIAGPAGIQVVRASEVTPALPYSRPADVVPEGRQVQAEQIARIAQELASAQDLPRVVADDVVLTEAFVALAQFLAAIEPPEFVILPPLLPPENEPSAAAPDPLPTAAAIRATAADLVGRLRTRVPNLIDVGDDTLTAGHFLVAMAWVVHADPEDDARLTLPAPRSPSPMADDLGWGVSQ